MATAAAMPLRIRAERERPAPDAVVEWRFDELVRAGVDGVEALRTALDLAVDIADVRMLVGRGCPPALAVRITR
jgi:hypothetical protein